MKKPFPLIICLIVWFAVIAQYFLMMENRTTSLLEMNIRFISFFTILTNTLVAIYFTFLNLSVDKQPAIIKSHRTLTGITIYITVVGLIYQVILRQLWQPEGLQWLVNELLHTINPILVIVYWWLHKEKRASAYSDIPKWLIYPLVYLIYILIRGNYSGFYPYPFVDVSKLGMQKVLINSVWVTVLFIVLSIIYVAIERGRQKK